MDAAGGDDKLSLPQLVRPPGAPPAGGLALATAPCPDPVREPVAALAWLEARLREGYHAVRQEALPARLLALLRPPPHGGRS
jgi:hypothetical protein